jgi:hypothetical protein
MSDSTPLIQQQYDALMDVWRGLNCSAQWCRPFGVTEPCPRSARRRTAWLLCVGIFVRQLNFDERFALIGATISTRIGQLTALAALRADDQGAGLAGTLPTQLGLLKSLHRL